MPKGARYTDAERDIAVTSETYEQAVAKGWDRGQGAWRQQRHQLRKQGYQPGGGQVPLIGQSESPDLPSWREFAAHIRDNQQFRKRTKTSSTVAELAIPTDGPIALIAFGDLHLASWATDYDLLERVVTEIVETPNLYCVLLGDILQLSVKLRGVAEVLDNAVTPEMAYAFADSLLEELAPKVAAATWGNHDAREEALLGTSRLASMYAKKGVIYYGGIGHLDLHVGQQVYRLALSHHFRGRSIYNPVHGAQRYLIFEGQDREIAMCGDSHVPGMLSFRHSGEFKVAINSGTVQTRSEYARRYFSIRTHSDFPLVELSPDERRIRPYWSIADWLASNRSG